MANPTPLNVPDPQRLSTLTPVAPTVPNGISGPAPQRADPVLTPQVGATATTATTSVSTPYTDAIVASAPKLWWRFNDASPSAVILDTEGFANGTVSNPATTLYRQPGLITEVSQFSQGSVDNSLNGFSAAIPAGVPLTHFTVEWWMAVQPVQNIEDLIGVQTDVADAIAAGCTAVDGSGQMQTGSTLTALPAGTFQATGAYYAITYDGSHLRFYKNGVLVATSQANALAGARIAALAFGGALGIGAFGGFVDELALYDKLLSASDLLAHYNAGIAVIVTTTTISANGPPGVLPGATAVPGVTPPAAPVENPSAGVRGQRPQSPVPVTQQ